MVRVKNIGNRIKLIYSYSVISLSSEFELLAFVDGKMIKARKIRDYGYQNGEERYHWHKQLLSIRRAMK